MYVLAVDGNADECCNFGGQGTSVADVVAGLQRLLEGIRYLWSVAVSLQHPKTFSLESFHLLAAGLCCIWGVRAFPAFSVAAASLLRSAEGLLLLVRSCRRYIYYSSPRRAIALSVDKRCAASRCFASIKV